MFGDDSVVQLVTMSDDAVLVGVAEVVVSNPSWGERFSASNDISDLLKLSDVASDVGVNMCNVQSCLTRQTMRFSQIREAIFLALIFLSTHAQL